MIRNLNITSQTYTGGYRYGFNGEEMDDEIRGTKGASYDLGARMYDPRVARMLSVDPWENKYAWQSTYAYYSNNPIANIDWKGYGGEIRSSSGFKVQSVTQSFKYSEDCRDCGTDKITMVEQQVVHVTKTIDYPSGTVLTVSSTETITRVTTVEIDEDGLVSSIYQETSTATVYADDPLQTPNIETNSAGGFGTIDLEKGMDSESIPQQMRDVTGDVQSYKAASKKSPIQVLAAKNKATNGSLSDISIATGVASTATGTAAMVTTGSVFGAPAGVVLGVASGLLGVISATTALITEEENAENITLDLELKNTQSSKPSYSNTSSDSQNNTSNSNN